MSKHWTSYYKEGFLIQLIFYAMVWVMDEYAGMLLCSSMALVITGLLLLSCIVEMVERSKVPKKFFIWMVLSALSPAIVAMGFTVMYGGDFNWLEF